MLALLLMGQAIAAAPGPVAIESEAQAKAMTPTALADRLLAPRHPPVDFAFVGPPGLVPPPPPGAPPQFHVTLWTRPVIANEPDYCTRRRIQITVRSPGAHTSVTIDETATLFRFGRPCAARQSKYGEYVDAAAFPLVRDLARVRRSNSVKVIYSDRLPDEVRVPRYASGRDALAAVNLGEITWIGPARRVAGLRTDVESDLAALPADATRTAFFAGFWTGVVVQEHGRITRVWLHRAIPAPF
jgi:hypothetical protein